MAHVYNKVIQFYMCIHTHTHTHTYIYIYVYCKKAKWLSEKALQIAEKRREAKGKGEKER